MGRGSARPVGDHDAGGADAELAGIFGGSDQPPLLRDSANFGHIHAPSLDQAVTAAVLRNGHLSDATPAAPALSSGDWAAAP